MNDLKIAMEVSQAINEIYASDAIVGAPTYITLKFFNKLWNIPLTREWSPEPDIEREAKLIKRFVKDSARISNSIERVIISKVNDGLKLEHIPKTISSYNDIPGLTITSIEVEYNRYEDKSYVVLRGEYDFDMEHGWSLSFDNNKLVTKNWLYYMPQSSSPNYLD